VSTILDALKRLEEERRAENALQVPLSLTERSSAPQHIRLWTTGLILTGLVMIGVVAALIWVNGGWPGKAFYGRAPDSDPMEGTPSPDARKRSVSAVPIQEEGVGISAKTAEVVLPPASRRSGWHERARLPSPTLQKIVPPSYSEQIQAKSLPSGPWPGKSASVMSYPKETKPLEPTVSAQPIETDMQQQNSQFVAPAPHTAATGSDGRAPWSDRKNPNLSKTKPDNRLPETPDSLLSPTQDPYTDSELLDRGTLRLQAISWSDNPGVRITVINDRILHEGQNIDGYIVVQIRPKEVIVGKGGKHWKLAYGNQ